MSGELLLDRYRVVRTIKDDHAVRTLLAEDTAAGPSAGAAGDGPPSRVVIKAAEVSRLLPAARLRLEHEAGVLRRLDSPYTARLVNFGRHGGLVCLVTEFVPGPTLEQRLVQGPLPLAAALAVGRCLLEGLRDAHDQGVRHRDVKPSNIVLSDASPLPTATLVDFGLARTEWLDPAIRDAPAGTVRYMSPEQAGLIERSPDERSDLYSAGAVLFEGLAGHPLVAGATLGEVLRRHLLRDDAELSAIEAVAPRAVADLLKRLLAPDPDDRYSSAESVLSDLAEIDLALRRGETEPRVIVGGRDRRRTLAEPTFVGRTTEVKLLVEQIAAARAGRGAVVLVAAASGGGKTRLLQEVAVRAARDGLRVCRGQGVDQAAQRPFEVLTGVAAALLGQAQADESFAATLRTRLGDHADTLCAALPDLAPIFPAAAAGGGLGPEAFGEIRTIEAIAALLDVVGTEDRPAVILLDDGQWADDLSLKLLTYWQRNAGDAVRHTTVVVAFRADEVEPGHPLRRLPTATLVDLNPLHAEEIGQLAESMAGPLPPEAREVLIRLSDGVPFMAAAVLRGLVESGALTLDAAGWRVDADALADVRASRQAATFLARRIGLLPPPVQELLSVGAVLGKEFDPELAAELAGQDAATAFAGLEEARRRHIVWMRSRSDTGCTFVHDKLRETLLAQLAPERRRELHRAAALRLEALHADRSFDLAFHFHAAGDVERALPYAWVAAGAARVRNALQAAQLQYEIAERGAARAEPELRLAIAEGLGDVLMLRGLYDAAGTKYAAARDLADDRRSVARIEGKIGELAFKRGDVRAASESVENALRSLGHRVPSSGLGFAFAALCEVFVQLAHTLFPRLFCGRRRPEGNEEEFLAIRLHSRLAHSYWFSRGSAPTLWTHLREVNLAERYPPSPELAQAYSEHAPVMTLIPLWRRGRRYGERSLAIRRSFGDVWGEGQSLGFLGTVLYGASRFEECIERCREGVRLLERTGDRWEVHTAKWHIAYSLYRLGDLAGAADLARSLYTSGVEIGDAQARGIALSVWSKATNGQVPAELVAAELDRPTHDVHTSAEVLAAEAQRLLGAGDPAGAAAVLARARTMVRKARMRQEYVAPLGPWYATALREQAAATPSLLPDRRRAAVRRARRAARRSLRQSRLYGNNRPHALREAGLLAAMGGRPRRARRLLGRSIAAADALHMRHEHALSLLARAEIGIERDWAGSVADLTEARAALAGQDGVPAPDEAVTPSLVDRFDAVLEEGRTIATALTRDAVYTAVRDAAVTLLRGERCLVLEAVPGASAADGASVADDLVPVAGHAPGEFSRAVARRALLEGRPVILDEQSATNASESVVLAGVRSVLCAPILVHGRAVACFYVEHRRVGGLFGPDESRIADFVATLAGAALENADNFAEIQELTLTLERRVAERTTELSSAYDREREITAQLRRLDQLKTEFLAMAAHDLRNPITVIAGFAATLSEDWEHIAEEERRTFTERISANARRLSEFVENLLQFARIESGELSYDSRPFDLDALVRRTVSEQSATARRNRLTVRIAPLLPAAVGDEQRYWQVLTNLFANAAKFSPEDSPIEVEVHHRAGTLEVSVRDHGPGIRPEDLPKLFQKFSRTDDEATRRAPGTGLGLYICKSIVETQGGRLSIASTPGDGATFTFTVPTAEAASIAAPRQAPTSTVRL